MEQSPWLTRSEVTTLREARDIIRRIHERSSWNKDGINGVMHVASEQAEKALFDLASYAYHYADCGEALGVICTEEEYDALEGGVSG